MKNNIYIIFGALLLQFSLAAEPDLFSLDDETHAKEKEELKSMIASIKKGELNGVILLPYQKGKKDSLKNAVYFTKGQTNSFFSSPKLLEYGAPLEKPRYFIFIPLMDKKATTQKEHLFMVITGKRLVVITKSGRKYTLSEKMRTAIYNRITN